MKTQIRINRTLASACAALAVMGAATLAPAQVRQLQMNAPMDANPQVGSGGANKPVQGFVPINGNEVVSGNVAGLRAFHGRTGGITSTYEFRGRQGTSNLQNFARQSAGSGQINGALDQVYYLPSSTVSTGPGGFFPVPGASGFDSQLIPRNSISPIVPLSDISRQARNASALYRNDTPLRIGAVGARESTEPTVFSLRPTEVPKTLSDTIVLPGQTPDAGNKPGTPGAPGTLNEPGAENKLPPEMIQGNINGNKDPRITSQTPELAQVRTPDLGSQSRVSESYAQLMEEIRRNQNPRGITGTTEEPAGTDTLAQGGRGDNTPGRGNTPTRPGMIDLTGNGVDIDPFTGQPRRIVPSIGQQTAPGAPGTRGPSRGGIPSYTGDSLPANRLEALSTEQLQAGSKVKPVRISPNLSPGATLTSFDIAMVRAEQSLKAGKFLDAADTYQSALIERPADPLALVGRSHAQLGAGMYASAANDLKFVFTRRPELVSVKYDVNSFIPASRQEFLLEDLKKLSNNKETADTASFLYSYLCYQTGRTALLQAELKTWGERQGHDAWQTVLHRAWNMPAPQPATPPTAPR